MMCAVSGIGFGRLSYFVLVAFPYRTTMSEFVYYRKANMMINAGKRVILKGQHLILLCLCHPAFFFFLLQFWFRMVQSSRVHLGAVTCFLGHNVYRPVLHVSDFSSLPSSLPPFLPSFLPSLTPNPKSPCDTPYNITSTTNNNCIDKNRPCWKKPWYVIPVCARLRSHT